MTETPNDPAGDPRQIIAELQRKLDERTAERDEATAQQAATAEVLKVISRALHSSMAERKIAVVTVSRSNAERLIIFRILQ